MSVAGGRQQHPHGGGEGGDGVGARAPVRSVGPLSYRVTETHTVSPSASSEHAPSVEQDGAQP